MRPLFSFLFVLFLTPGHSAMSDTTAVKPRKITSAVLDQGKVLIPGQGQVPGLDMTDWGASAARLSFKDDSTFSGTQFDARSWLKLDHLDSLRNVDHSTCWLRFLFIPDSSLGPDPLHLQMSVVGHAELWLDGTPLMVHELREPLSGEPRLALDTTAFFSVPFPVDPDGKVHVLAMRLYAGHNGQPLRTLRASLHKSTAMARMHRGAVHFALFVGVNAFILVMALMFWWMDKQDRIWHWFAALTAANAFIAFTDLAHWLDLGFSHRMVIFLDRCGDALRFAPFSLSVLLLVVMLGQAKGRSWRMYIGSAILFSLIAPILKFFEWTITPTKEILWFVVFIIILLVAMGGGLLFLIETIRLSIRVMRSKGFQRWIGAGVLIGSTVPIMLPMGWALWSQLNHPNQSNTIPEGIQTAAEYIGYIALPLSIITALAIRTTHQNRMLSRQRDDLDREVHERTAELRQERDRSDTLLLNILPHEVAEELKRTGAAEARHFEQATVLFSDFKGFTEMSGSVSPAELIKELNVCFKAFDDIIGARGIEKIKTIGDAYMCAAGLPDPKSSSPADMVFAALAMQDFMADRHTARKAQGLFAFEMRLGIHTGPVVAGIVGVKKFQYDIWGDTVNMASRMETTGEVGRVNISDGTYALVKDALDPAGVLAFGFTHRGPIAVKGKGTVEMWFVARS